MTVHFAPAAALMVALAAAAIPAAAADRPEPMVVTIKDHRFTPAEIHVPAGQPAIVRVVNLDPSAEEVESGPLNIEKVIPPGAHSVVRLPPLAAGRYRFYGEYHPDTAQGAVVAQ